MPAPELVACPNGSKTFQNLVSTLSNVLGSSGIDSEDVSASELLTIMKDYTSNLDEWDPFIANRPKEGECYTRNLVDGGNGKYNLLLLVWRPGEGSRVHDHTKHCCMKILKGRLRETLFSWPDQDLISHGQSSPPVMKKESLLEENEVSYISNSIGLHSVFNPDPENYAVSLHLYTPPAKVCLIFDRATGESSPFRL